MTFPLLDSVPTGFRLTLALVFMALLAGLSLVPGTPQPGDSEFIWAVARTPTFVQKTMHLVLYGVLAGLWLWTLRRSALSRARQIGIAATISILYGAAMELGQLVVPGRFSSIVDVFLNTSGVALAIVLSWGYRSGGR